ncbi:MAG: hypothetical protein ACXAD7_25285, partial [Candidatus Kariarchaeaceae archaeon]
MVYSGIISLAMDEYLRNKGKIDEIVKKSIDLIGKGELDQAQQCIKPLQELNTPKFRIWEIEKHRNTYLEVQNSYDKKSDTVDLSNKEVDLELAIPMIERLESVKVLNLSNLNIHH